MRIAFFVSGFPALSETFIINQIVDLLRRGHEVEIFATHPVQDGLVHQPVQDFQLVSRTTYLNQLPSGRFRKMMKLMQSIFSNLSAQTIQSVLAFLRNQLPVNLSIYHLIHFLPKGNFDVVHAHFGKNGVYVSDLRRMNLFQSSKFITTFHGYDQYPSAEGSERYADLFNNCDWVTVNSNYSREKLLNLGCQSQKLVLLPAGLDITLFKTHLPVPRHDRPITILFVGRLIELKGAHLVVQICSMLKNRKSFSFHTIIVGDGEMKHELEQLIHELSLEEEVFLAGGLSQQQVLDLMGNANLFLFPGLTINHRAEAQGLVIQEAQAMELPVVVSDAGGMKEGMVDGVTGFVVPEKNLLQFVHAVEALAKDPDLRGKMGAAGRTFVQTHYSIQHLNDRLLQLYS